MKAMKERNPMESEDKMYLWIGIFIVLGISSVIGGWTLSAAHSNDNNHDAEEQRLDFCGTTDDPTQCLVVMERIEACDNLEDGEDNCMSAIQLALQ